jgi:hemerythrin-like domain-containing protein
MSTFSEYMGSDHQRCDELFALAEQAADAGDAKAVDAHEAFVAAMEHHFGMEEGVLFPAFEEATGSSMGPTAVMRHEHEQMRQLFAQMSEELEAGDYGAYLGTAETLLILMQQHNAKEEQILYPMSDRALAARQQDLLKQMQAG